MKSFMKLSRQFALLAVLTILTGICHTAIAAVYVNSVNTGQILQYDQNTGQFQKFFVNRGNPGPLTFGPNGNLFAGMVYGIDSIQEFDGATGALKNSFSVGDTMGDIVFGSDNNLYVTCFGSDTVKKFSMKGQYLGDFVSSASGSLDGPTGLTFGPDGNLYVASRINNKILRYNGKTGAFVDVFAVGGDNGPMDLAFGPDNNLYVATSYSGPDDSILRFDGQTGALIDNFIPLGRQYHYHDPMSVTFGPDGNLYIPLEFQNCVVRFNGTTGAFMDEFIHKQSGAGIINFPISVVFSPVPEPSTLALLLTAALGGLLWWRRRR